MRPGRSAGAQIDVGGGIAEGFHAAAALDQTLARADQGFELDGFDLAAILFPLKAILCLLVIVEFGLDPLDSAVEGVFTRCSRLRGTAGSRNKGLAVCANRATIGRSEVEARVLSSLRDRLLQPDLVATFVEEYGRQWNNA